MTDWFVKGQHGVELSESLRNTNTTIEITTEMAAKSYLAWSEQFESDFDLIREACETSLRRDGW